MNDATNMNEELLIKRINEVESLILQLRREIKDLKTSESNSLPQQQYYSLKDAVLLKYGPKFSYSSISTNYCLMPCGNSHYQIFSGKRMWSREKILEWLNICDSDMPAYLERYNVPLKGRFAEKYKKYIKKEDSV